MPKRQILAAQVVHIVAVDVKVVQEHVSVLVEMLVLDAADYVKAHVKVCVTIRVNNSLLSGE